MPSLLQLTVLVDPGYNVLLDNNTGYRLYYLFQVRVPHLLPQRTPVERSKERKGESVPHWQAPIARICSHLSLFFLFSFDWVCLSFFAQC